MPGLDVVRGTAIVMVLLAHGLGENGEIFWGCTNSLILLLRSILFLGVYGVHVFFVLSGFLITGILLESRASPDYYKHFYLRRVLRILPAYLVLLAVLKSSHWITWRFLIASLLYLSNMPRLFGANTEYGGLWSLSVEEQFYLTWPILVRTLHPKALLRLSIALVAVTPALRFGLLYGPSFFGDTIYKTWDVMDFFAAGAILAIVARSPRFRPLIGRICPWLLAAGLVVVFGLIFVPSPSGALGAKLSLAFVLEPWLLVAVGFVGLGAARPAIAKAAIARPLVFLGNVSYGLYLCHQAVYGTIDKHWPVPSQGSAHRAELLVLRFLLETALAILIAWISRRTLEEFFLRLKPTSHQSPLGTT
jgi:peptidoglycan/LPS O-acetylase OafA/YrhL